MTSDTTRRRRRGARTRRILRGLQVLAGLAAVTGALLAWQEWRPFLMRLEPAAEQRQVFLAMEPRPARFFELESQFARRARIEACADLWTEARNDPAVKVTESGALLQACRNAVLRNLTIAPASSNDWLVAAILAQAAGDLPATTAYLKRSLATGPTEQWIARRRAPLLFELQGQIDDDLNSQIDPQFALMLRTEDGVQSLARIYLDNRAFRERIIKVAETVEPAYQQRFLNYVNRWAGEARPAGPSDDPQ